jgi:hypothetical protein
LRWRLGCSPTNEGSWGHPCPSFWKNQLLFFVEIQRDSTNKDANNYFLLQLHICIEMTFGLLTNKWRTLRTSLSITLQKSVVILSAFACLHNFEYSWMLIKRRNLLMVLNFWPSWSAFVDAMPNSPLGWAYHPTVRKLDVLEGTSQIRQIYSWCCHQQWG